MPIYASFLILRQVLLKVSTTSSLKATRYLVPLASNVAEKTMKIFPWVSQLKLAVLLRFQEGRVEYPKAQTMDIQVDS